MDGNNDNVETREEKIDWQFPELLSNEGLIEFMKGVIVNFPPNAAWLSVVRKEEFVIWRVAELLTSGTSKGSDVETIPSLAYRRLVAR